MTIDWEQMESVFFLIVGAGIILTALTAKVLISEDPVPTEEERQQRPTLKERILLTLLGLAALINGALGLWSSLR
jgi:hypothetical protein